MIRLAPPPDLSAGERFGLDTLVDLSRLLVVDDAEADVVRLGVSPTAVYIDQFLTRSIPPERSEGEVRVPRQVLSHVTALAGAGHERKVTTSDKHGRVPTDESLLVRAGREREPVVQEYAEQLRAAVRAVAGRRPVGIVAPWPEGRRWAAAFTHDLDVVRGWPLFALLRVLELGRAGRLGLAGRVLGSALAAIGNDPVGSSLRQVLAAEATAGIKATWFALCGQPSARTWLRGDLTYDIDAPAAALLIEQIRAAGHEIGLHGSFATALDQDRMGAEREHLARLLGHPPAGVRQHFLKMRPGRTQQGMEAAGFEYDATFGFPDRNGFRLGVADTVPACVGERAINLELVPLVWMDRALSKYRGVENPDAWVNDALELATTCRKSEGLWVGLWHPNLTPALGFPGAPAAFQRLLDTILAAGPYIAPLQRMVAWRRARRGVRAARVAPDGRAELRMAPGMEAFPIVVDMQESGAASG